MRMRFKINNKQKENILDHKVKRKKNDEWNK